MENKNFLNSDNPQTTKMFVNNGVVNCKLKVTSLNVSFKPSCALRVCSELGYGVTADNKYASGQRSGALFVNRQLG